MSRFFIEPKTRLPMLAHNNEFFATHSTIDEERLCELACKNLQIALAIWHDKPLRGELSLETIIEIASHHIEIATLVRASPELYAELDVIHCVKLALQLEDLAKDYYEDRDMLDEECLNILRQIYPDIGEHAIKP
jgi:hypothetical protein